MIEPKDFFQTFKELDVTFYSGVPDSLLKDLCAYITSCADEDDHVLAANEGGAIGQAIGYHLATDKVPIVYMQNSGLGNVVNPLLSMADGQVYGIPMVLLIGWRGEMLADGSQLPDEPQHKKQGKVTEALLEAMGIDYIIVGSQSQNWQAELGQLVESARAKSSPVAILIRKGTFAPYSMEKKDEDTSLMRREEAIEVILQKVKRDTLIVSTTGMISRELFEVRKKLDHGHDSDFLVVGGMGHASQIACQASVRYKGGVICLDGDGAMLMHMGGLAINPRGNFTHIILNNGAHDSVGGQPTVAHQIDVPAIAAACGYASAILVKDPQALSDAVAEAMARPQEGVHLVEVLVQKGNRKDLGRPTLGVDDMKQKVKSFLQNK